MDTERTRRGRRQCMAAGAWLFLSAPGWATAAEADATATTTEVNTANQAELEMVKGVGPQLSTQILNGRGHALFRDWTDFVARLPGVGPAKARKLSAAGLRVNGQAWSEP